MRRRRTEAATLLEALPEALRARIQCAPESGPVLSSTRSGKAYQQTSKSISRVELQDLGALNMESQEDANAGHGHVAQTDFMDISALPAYARQIIVAVVASFALTSRQGVAGVSSRLEVREIASLRMASKSCNAVFTPEISRLHLKNGCLVPEDAIATTNQSWVEEIRMVVNPTPFSSFIGLRHLSISIVGSVAPVSCLGPSLEMLDLSR